MRYGILLLGLGLLSSCAGPEADTAAFTLPAEWEPHEAVWFTYNGNAIDTVLDEVVEALVPSTYIVCVADNDSLAAGIRARWDSLGIARDRYRMEVLWDSLMNGTVRDMGPIFLRERDGGLAVLDAGWNYYGDRDNLVGTTPRVLALAEGFPASMAEHQGLPVVHSDLVIEGGACEINSRGDLLQVEAVTMNRNPGWSKDSIANELRRVFGARRVIWLKEGPTDDMWFLEPRIHGRVFNQGTGGHVDEFCRFVNDSTVLLAWPGDDELEDSVQLITRQRMEVNQGVLEEAGLALVKAPTPFTEYYTHRIDSMRDYDQRVLLGYPDLHHGDSIRYIPAAGYLNFLITNGCVVMPAYWHEGLPMAMKEKDERMRALLAQYFPDRRIVQVDPRAINWRGGGVHCWTQQQPSVEP